MYGKQEMQNPSPMVFGLNQNCKMVKFAYTPTGGKNNTEQDALDIIFNVGGKDVSYRQFPVTRAYGKDNLVITDPESDEMKKAFTNFNANITHIMMAFVSEEVFNKALSSNISDFKTFCNVLESILPKNYAELPIDLFFQYPYSETEGKKYLALPNNTLSGRWISAHVAPINGAFKEVREDGNSNHAMYYIDGAGNRHPFVKSTYFLNSNNAKRSNSEETTLQDNVTTKQAPAEPSTW